MGENPCTDSDLREDDERIRRHQVQTVLQGKMSARAVAGGSSPFPSGRRNSDRPQRMAPVRNKGRTAGAMLLPKEKGRRWLTSAAVITRLRCRDRPQAREQL